MDFLCVQFQFTTKQKKYFVKGDKSEQPQILTNTGRFVNIKKSVLKDDYYEEDPDDK